MFGLNHMASPAIKQNQPLEKSPSNQTPKMATSNTHILAIPFPLQGHINPILQLCNRLLSKGIRVTFVTTVTIGEALETKTTCDNPINVETVPSFMVDEVEGVDAYEIYIRSFRTAITSGLPGIIEKHRNSGYPVKAVVYDSVIPWVLDIAYEKGIKGAVLFTQSCTVSSIFYHLHKGTLEILPDEGSEVSLPGMPVMGLNDLPSMVYDRDSHPSLLRLLVEQFSTFEKADWRLFNTFDELEDEMLKWMATKNPIRTVGPTVPSMYIDKRIQGNYDYGLSLFRPKTEAWSEWLDKKEDHSVIYVSFGSLVNLSEKQMEEIAWGLTDTKCSFLWVVRDSEQTKLPQEFPSSDQNGLIVNWCSQLEILSHRAVGCFISHGGWNSTLEALSLGVPMVVMPQWTDQTTNGKFIGDVWQIGIRCKKNRNGVVIREEVKACVNDIMVGERGIEIRRNAVKWKDLAIEAVSEGGSSDNNIAEFAMGLIGE